jgi:hypothetical protein
MLSKAFDGVKISVVEWDSTPEAHRDPYVEQCRKNGFVYAFNKKDIDEGGEEHVDECCFYDSSVCNPCRKTLLRD